MKNIPFFGTFYKDKNLAYKKAKEKNKTEGRNLFIVLEGTNGYLVVSKRQVSITPHYYEKKNNLDTLF